MPVVRAEDWKNVGNLCWLGSCHPVINSGDIGTQNANIHLYMYCSVV